MPLAVISLPVVIFVLVLMGLRLLARTVGKNGNAEREQPPTRPASTAPPPLPRTTGPMSDNEKVRKFLEALGQPPGSAPPAPVAPRTDLPPRPVAPVRPPAAGLPIPPRANRRVDMPKRLEPTRLPERMPGPRSAPAPPSPITPKSFPGSGERAGPVLTSLTPEGSGGAYQIPTDMAQKSVPQGSGVFSLLRSGPEGLRAAMILREVFGPPRSLRPLEVEGIGSA